MEVHSSRVLPLAAAVRLTEAHLAITREIQGLTMQLPAVVPPHAYHLESAIESLQQADAALLEIWQAHMASVEQEQRRQR